MFKDVLSRYHNDFRKEGAHSYEYKTNSKKGMERKGGFLVRTFCAAYNHEYYIKDALQGFVMQETTFPVVYTIVDDASTDHTAEVIREFVEANFDLKDTSVAYVKDTDYGNVTFARHITNKNCYFAVVLLKDNHYSQKKSKAPYLTEWMDTKFVALCEGDDYWTDPHKLQKQYDFMVNHPDYTLCGCSTIWKNELNGKLLNNNSVEKDKDVTFEDFVNARNKRVFPTVSFFAKSEIIQTLPPWGFPVGDIPLTFYAAIKGPVRMLSDTMCVYRFFAKGSWTEKNGDPAKRIEVAKKMISALENMNAYYDYKYDDLLKRRIKSHRYTIALLSRDFDAIRNTDLREIYNQRSTKKKISDYMRCKHPWLFRKWSRTVGYNNW